MENPREATIVQTQNIGYLVSISRSVKTGTTATEVSNIRIEGHAKDKADALEALKEIDKQTQKFVDEERTRYGIPKSQPKRYIGDEKTQKQ